MQIANLEDIHKLSPVQQELLTRALDRPGDDLDVLQLCVALSGPLSLPGLEAAWEGMAARHSALRTAFRPGKVPSQVVQRQVKLPFVLQDRKHDAEIAAFLIEDRERGLDPAQGPLVRLSVLRTAPGEHLLVWTWHRLVLDGWSAALVAGQTLAVSQDAGPSRKYRELIDWLRNQNPAAAERFWRQELAGLSAPAPLGSIEPLPGRAGRDVRIVRLAPSATAALRSLADREGLALETLVQGAWALALSRHTGQGDVLFGITAAGRPADLPEAESRVGRFAHTLPLRVEIDPETPLLAWLRRLEDRRNAAGPHAHQALSQIRDWSGLPSGVPLFHSRLTVESLPPSLGEGAHGEITEIGWVEASPEPLAICVRPMRPGAELAVEAVYDRSRFEEAEIASLQDRLCEILEGFAADPGGPHAEGAGRLDRIVQMVHRREIPSTTAPTPEAPAPQRKEPGGYEIVPVSRDQPLPATFYQEWALQLDGVRRNCIPYALRITGPFDLKALRRALLEVVRRHESLRTSFRWEGGEACLELAPPPAEPYPIIDLTALPEARKEKLLRRLTVAHAAHEFDMERGPLFIAEIARLGDRDHALLMNLHHLISDGWSIQVLQRELMVLYGAFLQGRPSPLPPLPIQLADFAWWQRRVFARDALAAQLAWWRSHLADLPPPPAVPNDLPRPEEVGTRPVDASTELPPGPSQALRDLAQATRSSLPMVLLAAIDALLHAYSGEEDLVLSLIFAARNRPELSGQIGLFMNTVPLRSDLSGNPSFRQLVERVRDAVIDAYSHQDVPFPRLLAELFPDRKQTRTALTGVCFNMLSFTDGASSPSAGATTLPGGLSLQPLSGEEAAAKHDLVFSCLEGGGTIQSELTGAADLFTPERMDRVARDFAALLAHVAADPELPLAELRQLVGRRGQG